MKSPPIVHDEMELVPQPEEKQPCICQNKHEKKETEVGQLIIL